LPATLARERIERRPTAADARPRILVPGRNCWRIAPVREGAVLIDAANYYAQLDHALRLAHDSILIVGWDFDGRIKLCPNEPDCMPLGELLRSLVEQRPKLHIHILIWSVAVVHAPGAPMPLLVGAPWQDHPRITLRLDRVHPLYAAHHQKIVCIDDDIAFVGGIDLTVRRWDTCDHGADDPLRADPDGLPYHAVHDVQMVVTGDVARAVAAVARGRWSTATGQVLTPLRNTRPLWPGDIRPDFTGVPVAIARTAPEWGRSPAIKEISALTIDALTAARHCVYIESQYFAAGIVAEVLTRRLAARDGPEVVVIVARTSHGWIEHKIMGKNRSRLIRRLKECDHYGRLRVYYPVVPTPEGDCDVFIHAKVMIVDNNFLRIGSANLNNRSMGLDTECDLAVEAEQESTRQAISRVRDRLIGEHLAANPDDIGAACSAGNSLLQCIERFNHSPRCLRPIEVDPSGRKRWVFGTRIFDPPRPFEPLWFLRRKREKGTSEGR
jgi:phosphatidylserine/phosphatidylglycerophosphate/cardiolipin synthase-like enzyme